MTTNNDTNARFDVILDLEHEVRLTKTIDLFAPMNLRAGQKADRATNAASAQARLFAAIDSLTPAEATAFTAYRRTH